MVGTEINQKFGLEPVVFPQSHTLILGTLPGSESLRRQQYYANQGNQFWKLIEGVYGETLDSTYPKRIDYLKSQGIALWDILQKAERLGSSDKEIKKGVSNDFISFFELYPNIHRIVLTGKKCQTEWNKLKVSSNQFHVVCVPSSSGTPGKYVKSLAEKITAWKEALL